jgi:hypothetical protein
LNADYFFQFSQVFLRIVTGHPGMAPIRLAQAFDHFHRCRCAGTIRAKQTKHFTLIYLEIDSPYGLKGTIIFH